MLKGAPTIKQVLEKLKEFCSGYCVYSSNSEFDNDFLSYYGEKAGVELELPKKQYYDVISLFLHSKCGAGFYLEFLDSGYEYETVYLAEQLSKKKYKVKLIEKDRKIAEYIKIIKRVLTNIK